MSENIKIGILGGDRRMLIPASVLSEKYECAVWGFDTVYSTEDEKYLEGSVRCKDPESAIRSSSAVILPLPASRDGVSLNSPLTSSGKCDIKLTDICRHFPMKGIILGGMLPAPFKRFAAEHNIEVYDYYDSEELQIKNAIPTAEGAIAACIDTVETNILGMKVAVAGYGRVGRTLAAKLSALGASVTAIARSAKDLAWAEVDGMRAFPLGKLCSSPLDFDVIFNTVPYKIWGKDALDGIGRNTVIFELASLSAGVDTEYAEKIGVRVIPLPSLPGKTSPISAGKIISDVISSVLSDRFGGEAGR